MSGYGSQGRWAFYPDGEKNPSYEQGKMTAPHVFASTSTTAAFNPDRGEKNPSYGQEMTGSQQQIEPRVFARTNTTASTASVNELEALRRENAFLRKQ